MTPWQIFQTIPVRTGNVCADGIGWTETSIPNSEQLSCIAYGNGLFAAGGIRGGTNKPCAVWSDDDGVTWNESSTVFADASGYGFSEWSMAYGNGIWLAGVNAINGMKSADGKTWGLISVPHFILQGAYGSANFVYTSSYVENKCYTTTDGDAFTARTLPSSGAWNAVGSDGAGKFMVARGDVSPKTAFSSDDGVNWVAGGDLPFDTCASIAYGNGTWVAVPYEVSPEHVAYSTDDGANWNTSDFITSAATTWRRVRFLQGRFLLVGTGGSDNYNSADGITWSAIGNNVNMTGKVTDWDGDGLGAYAAIGNAGSNSTVANYGICAG